MNNPPDIPAILAEVDRILSGIDKTENEASNGYWETSVGVRFGAGKLSELKEMITNSLTKKP